MFRLHRSEPSVQFRQHDSYSTNLVAKGTIKEFLWYRGRTIECALRTAVAVFAHQMCIDWCKSLSQPLKWISLTPHEAPEVDKLQVASYVGAR